MKLFSSNRPCHCLFLVTRQFINLIFFLHKRGNSLKHAEEVNNPGLNMNNEVLKVTSEILPFFERDIHSKPQIDEKNIVSKFTFNLPPSGGGVKSQVEKDEDGDYVLARKGREKSNECTIYLEHSVSTELGLVGLQIWRAALLTADFIIHFRDSFAEKTVAELGSGVGLTSTVAAMFARKVICTDLDVGNILTLIKSNVERNKEIIKADVCVLGLDFFRRDWSPQLRDGLEGADVVIAADVIYDNDVTQAFVETVTEILSLKPGKKLYLALEKRYVFTISDLDSVAPCYEHLMTCLGSARAKPPFSEWTMREVPLDFPQYFNYERVRQLVMYEIAN